MVIGYPLRPRYARPPLPKGEARCFPGYFSPSGTRCARPPLPKGEARCFPGYFSPSGTRCARPPLPKGEARCFPGYFTPSGTRCARPPLPKGEARDARAVHRKVYRSAPFISSANWSLLLDTVVFECFIFSDKAKAYLFQHMLTPSIFPDGICVYRSFVINIGLKQVHIHIDRRIIRPMLVQFVT